MSLLFCGREWIRWQEERSKKPKRPRTRFPPVRRQGGSLTDDFRQGHPSSLGAATMFPKPVQIPTDSSQHGVAGPDNPLADRMADAFLADILEHPEDDVPRLIYADWLTDQDEPLGEFIRVQCQLARINPDYPHRLALEEAEHDLLARNQQRWLGWLHPLLSRWTFRRGFLDEAVVPVAVYMEDAVITWPATVQRIEVDLTGFQASPTVLGYVPESIARDDVCFPLGFRSGTLFLAMQAPEDLATLEKLQFILNRDIVAVPASPDQIRAAILRHFGEDDFRTSGNLEFVPAAFTSPSYSDFHEQALGFEGYQDFAEQPIIRVSNLILSEAIQQQATEIHIEPTPDRCRILFRIAGSLVERDNMPRRVLNPLVARIRIMAGMYVLDQRELQEGRISLVVQGKAINLHVLIRRTIDGPDVLLTWREDSPLGQAAFTLDAGKAGLPSVGGGEG